MSTDDKNPPDHRLAGGDPALRDARLQALRAEIQKGLDSGPAEALDIDDIIAEGKRLKAAGVPR